MIVKEAIRWNYLIFATAVAALFAVVLTAAGHKVLGALIATSLIVWWGYIPGFISPYLKEVSMGDFFAVLLVPAFGALPVAIWGFLNVFTMLIFGKLERPVWVFRGAVVYFITIMIIPILYKLAHGNTLYTMYYLTIVFYTLMGIFAFVISAMEFFEDIKMVMIAVPVAFISNTLYLVLFGPFTNNLIKNGMTLDFTSVLIFMLILVFIATFYVTKWYLKRVSAKQSKL